MLFIEYLTHQLASSFVFDFANGAHGTGQGVVQLASVPVRIACACPADSPSAAAPMFFPVLQELLVGEEPSPGMRATALPAGPWAGPTGVPLLPVPLHSQPAVLQRMCPLLTVYPSRWSTTCLPSLGWKCSMAKSGSLTRISPLLMPWCVGTRPSKTRRLPGTGTAGTTSMTSPPHSSCSWSSRWSTSGTISFQEVVRQTEGLLQGTLTAIPWAG